MSVDDNPDSIVIPNYRGIRTERLDEEIKLTDTQLRKLVELPERVKAFAQAMPVACKGLGIDALPAYARNMRGIAKKSGFSESVREALIKDAGGLELLADAMQKLEAMETCPKPAFADKLTNGADESKAPEKDHRRKKKAEPHLSPEGAAYLVRHKLALETQAAQMVIGIRALDRLVNHWLESTLRFGEGASLRTQFAGEGRFEELKEDLPKILQQINSAELPQSVGYSAYEGIGPKSPRRYG
ncbi:MAG: hypothetical protein JO089_05185 [Alphaproteobacteria bacterium]|nr:hypothetical protein [Alphaproteobacteria bacterium]